MMLVDLRTPTLTIDGFSELLAKGEDGPLEPKQALDVGIIRKSSRQLLMLLDIFYDVLRFDDYQSGRVSREGSALIDDFVKLVDEALGDRHSAGSLRIDPTIDIICEIPEILPHITTEKDSIIRIIRLMVMSAVSALRSCLKTLVKIEVNGMWLDIIVIGNPDEIRYKFGDLKARYTFSDIYDSIDLEYENCREKNLYLDIYPVLFAVIHGRSKLLGAEFRSDVSESNATLIFRLPIDN